MAAVAAAGDGLREALPEQFAVLLSKPELLEPVAPLAAGGVVLVGLLKLKRGPMPWLDELPLRYDAERIALYWGRRPVRLMGRFVDVGLRAGSFFLQIKLDEALGKIDENMPQRAIQLRELITDLGPAFIKIAQVWASRPDVLPEVYNKEIQKLLEQVRPFGKDEALETLKRNVSDLSMFGSLDDFNKPVAAASIGQVYRTTVKGRQVAVKVQRPDVRETVTLDLYVIRQGAKIGSLLPFASLQRQSRSLMDLIDLATPPFVEELDYNAEASNQRRFAGTVEGCDLIRDTVVVPDVVLSTREVLVQEWLDGKKLTEPGAAQEQAGRVVKLLLNSYMVQFLETGYLHGDPHPGNFILMPSGKLGILDYGLMTEIEPNRRVAFIEYLMHLQAKEYDKCLQDLVNLEFIPAGIADDREAREVVIPALASTLSTLYEEGGDMRKKQEVFKKQREEMKANGKLDKLREQLQDISKKYGSFRLPGYFSLIIRAFSTLEGLGLKNNEDFTIVKECFPYIARRLLTDDSARIRDALRSYLYKGRRRIAVSRIDELASGFGSFTNLMKGSRGEAAELGGAPIPTESTNGKAAAKATVSDAAAEPAPVPAPLVADTATQDIAEVVFSRDGNVLQDLLIDEGVAAVDAMSRAALVGLLRFAGPLALPLALPLGVLVGGPGALLGNSQALLSRDDKEALLVIRRIVRLTQQTGGDEDVESRRSGRDLARTADELRRLQPLAQGLLPTIAPGAAAFARRFTQRLTRRVLLRLAEDIERSAGLMVGRPQEREPATADA